MNADMFCPQAAKEKIWHRPYSKKLDKIKVPEGAVSFDKIKALCKLTPDGIKVDKACLCKELLFAYSEICIQFGLPLRKRAAAQRLQITMAKRILIRIILLPESWTLVQTQPVTPKSRKILGISRRTKSSTRLK